jgi:hypothetical protein
VHRAAGRLDACQPRNDPGREVLRRQAAPCRRHVAARHEKLIEHCDAGLLDPGLRRQVRAGGNTIEQTEPGQDERAGALSPEQLS